MWFIVSLNILNFERELEFLLPDYIVYGLKLVPF